MGNENKPVFAQVVDLAVKQRDKGLQKYGQIVDENKGDACYWIDHAVEESMDHIFYLLRLKQELIKGKENICIKVIVEDATNIDAIAKALVKLQNQQKHA